MCKYTNVCIYALFEMHKRRLEDDGIFFLLFLNLPFPQTQWQICIFISLLVSCAKHYSDTFTRTVFIIKYTHFCSILAVFFFNTNFMSIEVSLHQYSLHTCLMRPLYSFSIFFSHKLCLWKLFENFNSKILKDCSFILKFLVLYKFDSQ